MIYIIYIIPVFFRLSWSSTAKLIIIFYIFLQKTAQLTFNCIFFFFFFGSEFPPKQENTGNTWLPAKTNI